MNFLSAQWASVCLDSLVNSCRLAGILLDFFDSSAAVGYTVDFGLLTIIVWDSVDICIRIILVHLFVGKLLGFVTESLPARIAADEETELSSCIVLIRKELAHDLIH